MSFMVVTVVCGSQQENNKILFGRVTHLVATGEPLLLCDCVFPNQRLERRDGADMRKAAFIRSANTNNGLCQCRRLSREVLLGAQ